MYHYTLTRKIGLLVVLRNLRDSCGQITLFSARGPQIFGYRKESPEGAIRRFWNLFFFSILHITKGKSSISPGWYIVFPFTYRFKRSKQLQSCYHIPNLLGNPYLNTVAKVKICG